MLTLSLADLYLHISQYFFPFLRILALFTSAPIFNDNSVNKKVKIALSLLIAFQIAPLLPDCNIHIVSYEGFLAGVGQVIIGLISGLIIQLIFVAVRHAGEIIGLQMGLSFATFYDRSGGQNMPVVARFLNLLATLIFLITNGHLYLLEIIARSFDVLPVSASLPNASGYLAFVQLAGLIFSSGLIMGLPIVALLLCINLTLGIINRLTPQLSVFVIGFPISLSVGLLALSLIMFSFGPLFENLMANIFDSLLQIMAAMR
ncbi:MULTISPECIES: flagellar biosynthetic protein FliR [unclassified Escherichia]|uniref:flagellar biosynthetic protein FliR n=1 Tax=unclassified Escherichia TaxID=2608889 RepID=UPI00107FEA9D|nr:MULTISPECIES: flagellar biosynthetic protein FliR [unclassified Escherichia]TGB80923.1 flagellar biosynthetic protein FliR [Escherichia sp. E4694]TLJ03269.1 flagellar biosynthetic protein FliR [Escherichia sp. E4385]